MVRIAVTLIFALLWSSAPLGARNLPDPAAAFGRREGVQSVAMSPDGRSLAVVVPLNPGQGAALMMIDPASGTRRVILKSEDTPLRITRCSFISNRRLSCELSATERVGGQLMDFSRLIALDVDGSNQRLLGQRDRNDQVAMRTWSGEIIDLLPGDGPEVLMAQTFIRNEADGEIVSDGGDGLGVVRLDTATGRSTLVERPRPEAVAYLTDGRGTVRMMGTIGQRSGSADLDSSVITYQYRRAGQRDWERFGTFDILTGEGARPLAVDADLNVAYVFDQLDGRLALFRVKLDGSLAREPVVTHDKVDVDGLIRVGTRDRVVGASYAVERRELRFFDEAIGGAMDRLRRALPQSPLIGLIGSSDDEQRLLLWAGSDVDPGGYWVFDRGTRRLDAVILARPELGGVQLARVRPVSYPAGDGTSIPGYLTLPPGQDDARGLPAIVLPHGGPSARDEWGFDWLAQFFAHRGYAVLQPNFRGSAGYGGDWFLNNGFQSWRMAIGDVADAGRWLIAQGIADPARLAAVGWSYGGYAALQASATAPDLFKAVVAIAPVTDLDIARDEWRGFTNAANVREVFGNGPHIREGSPARNASAIRAPVLLFHGERDRNVGVRQSRIMHDRLRGAGKSSELVTFEMLDHQLNESGARADMLRRSDAFLREALGIEGQAAPTAAVGATSAQRE